MKAVRANELVEFYIANYERDMKALNVLEPDFKPRATYYIEPMLDLIHKLSKNGFTYTLEDGVYFDTSKDEDYLSLSHRNTEENVSRLSNEVEKEMRVILFFGNSMKIFMIVNLEKGDQVGILNVWL